MRQSVLSYLLSVPWRQPFCSGWAVEVTTAELPKRPENTTMGQINVNPNAPATPSDASGAVTAASRNLSWAIAAVVIIAALAIAIVYVAHNVAF
jgi:hypothetical protein